MDKKQHYLVEKALADRLRDSTQEERKVLYSQVYGEYARLFPGESEKGSDTNRELRVIRKFLKPEFNFLEIGSGNGAFASEVARLGLNVTTLDVAASVDVSTLRQAQGDTTSCPPPTALQFNGISANLPPRSFDLAYSNQVLEHLHPDDLEAHFTMVVDSLKVGGKYIVITPHRYAGPHDVSRGFADIAEGLHLHEYTYGELMQTIDDTQLTIDRSNVNGQTSKVSCYYLRAGFSFRVPNWLPLVYEKIMSALPFAVRQPLARIKWPQVMVVLEKTAK